MLKRFLFISILLILLSNTVYADEAVQIKLEASQSEIMVGDSFQVSVQLKNASTANLSIGNINVPGIEDFEQRGSSQSTKVQIINGNTTAISETIFTLIATKEGEYKIGPIEIKTGALNVESNFVIVKVNKKKNNSLISKNKTLSSNKDWIVNIIALALLGFMLYLFYKRQRSIQPNIDDYEKNSRVDNVAKIDVIAKNDKNFFKKTKESLFLFIRKKYKINTESLTSQEVIKELKHIKISDADKIIRALNICDQGYFALNKSGKDELLEIIKKLN